MRVIGKVLLLLVLIPLVFSLGFIALMLNPFLEIILKEEE